MSRRDGWLQGEPYFWLGAILVLLVLIGLAEHYRCQLQTCGPNEAQLIVNGRCWCVSAAQLLKAPNGHGE